MIGNPVEIKTKTLICCVCHNASALQPPDAVDWACPNCLRLGLLWAARQAQQAEKTADRIVSVKSRWRWGWPQW